MGEKSLIQRHLKPDSAVDFGISAIPHLFNQMRMNVRQAGTGWKGRQKSESFHHKRKKNMSKPSSENCRKKETVNFICIQSKHHARRSVITSFISCTPSRNLGSCLTVQSLFLLNHFFSDLYFYLLALPFVFW